MDSLSFKDPGAIPQQPSAAAEPAKPKRSRQELGIQIRELANDGYSGREIANRLGIRRQRIHRIALKEKIELAEAGGRRRIVTGVKRTRVEVLDALAEVAGVSRSAIIERIVETALESGPEVARRWLGKRALPTRRYSPRKKAMERNHGN